MSGKRPITVFEETINRSKSMLETAKLVARSSTDVSDDILRGATVLSVAAYDRYFTAKFCDVLVPHLKESPKISDILLSQLKDAGLDTKFALELMVSQRPYRKIRTIVQNSLSRLTTHRAQVIDELFLSIGLKDLTKHAENKASRTNLRKRIQKLVDMRNEISHEAHINAHGNAKRIDIADVEARIEDLKLFVKCCDEIVESKFGKKPPVSA